MLSETDIQINVRANIDKNNARFFHSFQDHLLNSKFKGRNIFIYPSIVYDFDDISSCQSSSGCLLNKNDYSKFLVEQFYVKKNINLNYFPSAPDIECMAKHINAFLIGADGDIYKCWVDIGNKGKRIGNINDPSIKNYDILAQYMVEMDVFEDSKCRECILLPSCLGGCPNERIKSATNEDIDYCSPMVNNLKSFLEIQYLIDSNNQSKINK